MKKSSVLDNSLLDKIPISVRVPKYVIQYCKQKNISYPQLLMKGFDSYRSYDVEHALNRLKYHEDRVLHWRGIVLHNEQECNTKHQICNTIKQQFIDNGRGNPTDKRQDVNWLEPKADELRSQGIPITVEELYNFCIENEVKNDG